MADNTRSSAGNDPRPFDTVELTVEVTSAGMTIPAGSRGMIVSLQGTPVDSFSTEFRQGGAGTAILVDLQAQQFTIVQRSTAAAQRSASLSLGQAIMSWMPFALPALGGLAGIALVQSYPLAQINPMYAVGGGILAGFGLSWLVSRLMDVR